MNELLTNSPAPDKATQQLAWVAHMNSLKLQAEELVVSELIYSWSKWFTTKAGLHGQPFSIWIHSSWIVFLIIPELWFSQFKNCENHNVIILILIILIIVILILSYPFRLWRFDISWSVISTSPGVSFWHLWKCENDTVIILIIIILIIVILILSFLFWNHWIWKEWNYCNSILPSTKYKIYLVIKNHWLFWIRCYNKIIDNGY